MSNQLYKKFAIISLIVIFALGSLGLGLYAWWSHLGEPQYQGQVKLKGLKEKVAVSFDQNGIPHIKANNEHDLYRSLGHVMAQERLFQMDLLRRVVRGELAEVFGSAALKTDILFRSLGLIYGMEDKVKKDHMDPHLRSLMEAFYDGVNQFIDKGHWSYEYKLLGLVPKKFEVIDGLGLLGYKAYSFAQAFKVDLLLDKIKREKGEDYANSLRAHPLIQTQKKVGQSHRNSKEASLEKEKHLRSISTPIWRQAHTWLEENIGMFSGSNAWALSASRSSHDHSLLASDPHVTYSLPGIWFEAVVDWGEGPFSGLFVPGVPFAAMGHNEKLGWGVTISYIDDMDFYREKIKGDQLFYKGQWIPMEKRREKIKVKGESDHILDLHWGVHGPILDRVHPLMEGKLAMKWGHFSSENRSPMAFYKMMKSKNITEFTEAMALAKSPGLNIVYADRAGNIGRYLLGSFPIRPDYMSGDLVYEGESGLYDWMGEVEFSQRAHIVNPESGLVVSANQKPEETDYAGYFQPSERYNTIKTLLNGKDQWSLSELKVIQTSAVSLEAIPVRDQILNAFKSQQQLSEDTLQALSVLKAWDGYFNKDSVAASLVQQTMAYAGEELLAPVKEEYLNYCDTNFYAHHVRKRILRDNPYPEIVKSFHKTLSKFKEEYGGWEQVPWGKIHTLTFPHPLSKGGKLLAKVFNLGPYEVSGAQGAINNLRKVGCRDGFTVKAGPSSRRLIDFSDPIHSAAIIPTGNSGHWKSPFFNNQWESYEKGIYRASLLQSTLSESERFGLLEFIPQEKKKYRERPH